VVCGAVLNVCVRVCVFTLALGRSEMLRCASVCERESVCACVCVCLHMCTRRHHVYTHT